MVKIFRALCFLVLLNTLLIYGCDSGTTTNNNFQVVVFSDIHFDPFYDPSLFPALVSADASEWADIFKTSSITAPSSWGSDTNYPLLVLALSSMKQNLGASPLIIYTGDTLVHKFSQTFFTLYGSQDNAAMQAFADKTVAFITEQVRASAGNIPVMFAVGNNDSYEDLGPDSVFLSNTAESFYTEFLKGTIDHQAFLNTYLKGGYYSAELPGTNLMVIGLNTILLANVPPTAAIDSTATAELAWFDAKLASAKADGKKVWLLMHVPTGAVIPATAKLVDKNGKIASAEMMWNPDYQARFLEILSKYPGIIRMSLAGHTHMDEYRIMSGSDVLEITPAISSRSGNDPAYKVFTLSHDTFRPIDYRSLNYDLATRPGQLNTYYTFSSAYSMHGLLNESLVQLFPELVTDKGKQALYRGYCYSGHNSPSSAADTLSNPITDAIWPVIWSGIGKMDEQDIIDAVNSY